MRSIWWEDAIVKAIDQRLLPERLEIVAIKTHEEMAETISDMTVRGAPSIGAAGAYGMALAWQSGIDLVDASRVLKATRPTAHDLFHAIDRMLSAGDELVEAAKDYADSIVEKCRLIGEAGNSLIEDGMKVLTHCNAGALATIDFGTALAPIRVAHRSGKKIFVFVDETRPRFQGAKLTAWEMANEDIDHAVIADNAAGYYLRREVDLVIVGADRVAMNGDFANKIGTYEKAVLAKENGVPFYVAAPVSTFDPTLRSGDGIVIEQRSPDEVLIVNGVRIAPAESDALNPAFDVTPAKYVSGYITEKGVLATDELAKMLAV
ncbi:MAG: S-methyl-5-thioribose-1-phosphate isomerase [Thermoplasmata archaeon]|nr:S-methyl-5-thioribose-1-phosphate isomerase [Thermoplasmata archaeon]